MCSARLTPRSTMTTIDAPVRQRYLDDGFLVLRDVFPRDEIATVGEEVNALLTDEALTRRNNLRVRWQYHFQTRQPVFELFDPIVDLSPACARWSTDSRLLDPLAALLADAPLPIKDKLIYKLAGSGGYPLHQDFIAWPSFPRSFTTAVVAIDEADADNGCIRVYPGAHARGCLAPEDGNFHLLSDEVVAGFDPVDVALSPGDVLVFGAFMPHRSGINRSERSRRHLLFSYNAASDLGDVRREHYEAFHHWLRIAYGAMGLADLHFR